MPEVWPRATTACSTFWPSTPTRWHDGRRWWITGLTLPADSTTIQRGRTRLRAALEPVIERAIDTGALPGRRHPGRHADGACVCWRPTPSGVPARNAGPRVGARWSCCSWACAGRLFPRQALPEAPTRADAFRRTIAPVPPPGTAPFGSPGVGSPAVGSSWAASWKLAADFPLISAWPFLNEP